MWPSFEGSVVELLTKHDKMLKDHEESLRNILDAMEKLTAAINEALGEEEPEPEELN